MALSLRRIGTSRIAEGRIVPGPAPQVAATARTAGGGPRPSKVK